MKLKEVLEKGRAIAIEKGKCYLLFLNESFDFLPEKVEGFRDPDAPDVVIVFVPDVNDLRLFELEKEVKDETT